jgi:hypothetical protein
MTTTTRRNLLRIGTTAAAYAAGATIVTGGVALASQAKGAEIATVDRASWDRAFAGMVAASAADDAINTRYDAADKASKSALESEWDRLGQVRRAAEWELFELPAPDRGALLWKSELLFGECANDDSGCPPWVGGIMTTYMADARRLLARKGC